MPELTGVKSAIGGGLNLVEYNSPTTIQVPEKIMVVDEVNKIYFTIRYSSSPLNCAGERGAEPGAECGLGGGGAPAACGLWSRCTG